MRVQTLYAVAGLIWGLVLGPDAGLYAARVMGSVDMLYQFADGAWADWVILPFGAAIGFTSNDCDFGDSGLCVCKEQFGTMPNDTTVFLVYTGHKARRVNECNEGNVEGIAERDEAAALL